MPSSNQPARAGASFFLKVLVFLMFAMFAMSTDSVGTVIPEIIKQFHLGLTAAGSFQYASMSGIGLSAISLGFLADRLGRKTSILLGLVLFGASSGMFAAGHELGFFILLLFVAGVGIGIFKAGALALIGDITRSTREHRTTMNLIEGFFGVGAIVGPAIVTWFLAAGMGWKWVYLIAACLCAILLVATFATRFPSPIFHDREPSDPRAAIRMIGDPVAMSFALALMLYVGAEAAVYVWAPTYLAGYSGPGFWVAAYAVSIFFVLRAAGRFIGVWLLGRFDWTAVLLVCTVAMTALFWLSVVGGRGVAVFSLPASGLFMSVQYPTINSAGISCYEKAQHGAIAGLLLFFTCVSAVFAPLAMALLGDRLGDARYAIALGAAMATALALFCLWNWVRKPFTARLQQRNVSDYGNDETVAALGEAA
jgi:fucose permease